MLQKKNAPITFTTVFLMHYPFNEERSLLIPWAWKKALLSVTFIMVLWRLRSTDIWTVEGEKKTVVIFRAVRWQCFWMLTSVSTLAAQHVALFVSLFFCRKLAMFFRDCLAVPWSLPWPDSWLPLIASLQFHGLWCGGHVTLMRQLSS